MRRPALDVGLDDGLNQDAGGGNNSALLPKHEREDLDVYKQFVTPYQEERDVRENFEALYSEERTETDFDMQQSMCRNSSFVMGFSKQ